MDGALKEEKIQILIENLDKELETPNYAYQNDAAMDLRSREDLTIPSMERVIVKSGVKMAIPKGYVGLIWDRSGMAAKHSIHTLAGVIDSGYRGEIGVVLFNLGKEDFEIKKGDRIAQILIQPVLNIPVSEVENIDDQTQRGSGGFGSSGSS